jgi:hypothetical protein
MAGKRKFTDEEVKFIFSFKNRITAPEIAAECDKKWPERGISATNVRSVKSSYLIDARGNVQTQQLRQNLTLKEHDRDSERIASMTQAKYEDDEAEMQEFDKARMEKRRKLRRENEQKDFESVQSSEKVRATLGLPKWPSNANHPPQAATSALINEAREQGLLEPVHSERTPELDSTQVSQGPTLLASQTSAVQSILPTQVSTEGALMSTSNLSQTTALSSTKLKTSLGPHNPESNISLVSMASNRATNSDDTEYPTFYE